MTPAAAKAPHDRRHRYVTALAMAFAVLLTGAFLNRADYYLHAVQDAGTRKLLDFDAFYVAGQMGLQGRMAQAYEPKAIYAAEAAVGGRADQEMPWAYPPQFDLVVMALAMLNKGWAYVLFLGATLLGYAAVLRRIAGAGLPVAVIATAPGLVVTIFTGQNGLLTAGLIGAFALLALRARARALAGLPLGLMVIKPHLALGIGLWALLRGRWRLLAVAAAVVLASAALVTAVFGAGIWPAFLGGVHATEEILRRDGFQLFRLTSVFAALRALHLPLDAALAGQALAALTGGGVILWSVRRGLAPRAQLGLAVIASLVVSPYAYDYDMPIYGIGFALLWPMLAPRLGRGELCGVVALGWAVTGWSLWLSMLEPDPARTEALVRGGGLPAAAGLGVLVLLLWMASILARDPAEERGGAATQGVAA